MALVDWEAVVLDLECYIAAKNSHGQRDLLAKLAELRSEHRQLEGLPEKALRLYGDELVDALKPRPTDVDSAGGDAMDGASPIRRESTTPEGEQHGHRNTRSEPVRV